MEHEGNADFLAGGFKNTLDSFVGDYGISFDECEAQYFGIIIKLGKFGTIVADQTKIDSPDGERKM